MEFKICFKRDDNSKHIYLKHENDAYEVILKKYFNGIENHSIGWLIEKFGALYCSSDIFEKYYTVYQQGSLFNE
jgi:hypothetical protein